MAWKLLFITALLAQVQAPTTTPDANPISIAYGWAQLISTLTDRALWLFFLGLILFIAWWADRRKERVLATYRESERETIERLATLIGENSECLQDLHRQVKELQEIIERVERDLRR